MKPSLVKWAGDWRSRRVGPDGFTEEPQQFMEDHAEEWQPSQVKWDTFATSSGIIFTDCVMVQKMHRTRGTRWRWTARTSDPGEGLASSHHRMSLAETRQSSRPHPLRLARRHSPRSCGFRLTSVVPLGSPSPLGASAAIDAIPYYGRSADAAVQGSATLRAIVTGKCNANKS